MLAPIVLPPCSDMRLAVTLVILASTSSAHALKPSKHRAITVQACRDAGLADAFCQRVGAEVYDTDANEWDDLAAHAQITPPQAACDAANAAAQRVAALGTDVHDSLAANPQLAAKSLGRALHTLQDNCAHHGQTNPQHAWASISDFCSDTNLSPDTQPDAESCAVTETTRVFAAVRGTVDAAGIDPRALVGGCLPPNSGDDHDPFADPCRMYQPSPIQACEFLGDAQHWDGVDTRWNNAIVVPALRAALVDAISTRAAPTDVCAGNPIEIAGAPRVDVSNGPNTCPGAHLFCLGKADSADADALFGDDDAPTASMSGGCTTGGGGTPLTLVILAFALLRLRAASRPNARR